MTREERIKQATARTEAYVHESRELMKALENASDVATEEALMKAIDAAGDAWARDLGLPEDEIAQINRESEAAVDAQIYAEIAATLRCWATFSENKDED